MALASVDNIEPLLQTVIYLNYSTDKEWFLFIENTRAFDGD